MKRETVALQETFFRILAGLLVPLLFVFAGAHYIYAVVGFVLTLAAASGPQRRRVFICASLGIAFLAPHIFSASGYLAVDQREAKVVEVLLDPQTQPWLLLAAKGLLPMFFSFVCFMFARWCSSHGEGAKAFLKIALPLVAVLLFGLANSLSSWPVMAALILIFALTFAFYLWFIVLSLNRNFPRTIYASPRNFWLFSVFFWCSPLPFFEIGNLEATLTPEPLAPSRTYRALVRNICEIALAGSLPWVGSYVLFSRMDWPNPWVLGMFSFVALSPKLWMAWIIILTLAARFLATFYLISSIGALTLSFFGAPPVFNVNQPWKAKSFHEFIGRVMYFYNIVLTVTYWPVFVRVLRKVRIPDRLKLVILVFSSAFYFNYIFHLLYGAHLLFFNGFWKGLQQYTLSILPYALIFSSAIGVSVAFPRFWKIGQRFLAVRAFKVVCFFVLYAFIYSLAINYEFESVESRLHLMRYLLTGGR